MKYFGTVYIAVITTLSLAFFIQEIELGQILGVVLGFLFIAIVTAAISLALALVMKMWE